MKLPGLIVPPLTPFTEDLKVDEKALQAGVNYVVEDCNAAMVIAAGVEAQEYHYLTMEERKNLIAKTLEYVDGRCPVAAVADTRVEDLAAQSKRGGSVDLDHPRGVVSEGEVACARNRTGDCKQHRTRRDDFLP